MYFNLPYFLGYFKKRVKIHNRSKKKHNVDNFFLYFKPIKYILFDAENEARKEEF